MYHDVPSRGYLLPVAADQFAHAPSHVVAHHRASQGFFNAEAEAAQRQPVGANENSKVGTRAALRGLIDAIKFRLAHQPRLARKLQALRARLITARG